MAKYLYVVTYTAEGLKGLMAKGGTARVEAARILMEFVAASHERSLAIFAARPRRFAAYRSL